MGLCYWICRVGFDVLDLRTKKDGLAELDGYITQIKKRGRLSSTKMLLICGVCFDVLDLRIDNSNFVFLFFFINDRRRESTNTSSKLLRKALV